jgi:hypothetical protein
MSHNPTTFGGESARGGFDWDDCATLHRRENGGGLLHGFKVLRQGTLAELVRFVARLPEVERSHYMIEKAGDRQYQPYEIMGLASRADFPREGIG